jgi:hypothetical protein
MYIGGTDEKAFHHLFAEVIDNSMDEAVAGHASFIAFESNLPPACSVVMMTSSADLPGNFGCGSIGMPRLEPVRRRPGMYIGGTDEKAFHHLFAEVIDNSMDEARASPARRRACPPASWPPWRPGPWAAATRPVRRDPGS